MLTRVCLLPHTPSINISPLIPQPALSFIASPRLGAFNSLNLNNSTIPYYSSSSADGSPSPYVTASPVQSSLAFHPSTNASNPSAINPTPGNPSQVSTTRPFSPSQSISPPLTNLSGDDLTNDNLAGPAPFSLGIAIGPNHHPHAQNTPHGRARAMSSGTGSPSSSYASAGSLSGLGPHRTKSYGVAGIVNGQREKRRRATKREDDDDDDEEEDADSLNGILPTSEVLVPSLPFFSTSSPISHGSLSSLSSGSPPSRRSSVDTSLFISVVAKRREEIRRQRIESEQRRRDELRDGYRKLKEVLPASNQKSSKVSLLDRGKFKNWPAFSRLSDPERLMLCP